MNDTVVNKSELVIDALKYAHDHKLDINNKDDVRKILDVLDPEHKENVDAFVELLKDADTFMDMTVKERETKKTDLPN
jgi:hypothetical protein